MSRDGKNDVRMTKGKNKKASETKRIEFDPLILFPSDQEDNGLLLDLFDEFGYDVTNIEHWRWLLISFANKHFAERRGHPTKWTAATRLKLFTHWFVLKKKGLLQGNRENEAVMIQLYYKNDPLYKNTSVRQIYRNLLQCIREVEQGLPRPVNDYLAI
jgi:hypothetical protein